MPDKLTDILTLNMTRGVGSVIYRRLLSRFGSLEEVLRASEHELLQVTGVGPKLASAIVRSSRERAGERELDEVMRLGFKVYAQWDKEYPESLRAICDAPLVLYVSGTLRQEDAVAVAVVGSRRCTYYGRSQAERFGGMLARAGFCVVSGFARGVDNAAHKGALAAGGRTIAVLGSGINRIYPDTDTKLIEQVRTSGAFVTEFPLNTPPDARNFPRRNRIISALSLGVLVVEAGSHSGALITVAWAVEQGKEVFALPGKVDSPLSRGTHRLIKNGAKLVEDVDDIIDELQGQIPAGRRFEKECHAGSDTSRSTVRLNALEELIVSAIGNDARNIEDIIEDTRLPAQTVSSTLMMLTLKRVVTELPGKIYKVRTS